MEFKSTWTQIHNLFITPFYLPESDSFSVVLLPIQGLPVSYAPHHANVKLIHLLTSLTIYTSSYKFGDTVHENFWIWFSNTEKKIKKPKWYFQTRVDYFKSQDFFFPQYWNTSYLLRVRTRRTVGLHLAPGYIKDMNFEMLESHSVRWDDHSRKAHEDGDQWKEMQSYISSHTYFEEQRPERNTGQIPSIIKFSFSFLNHPHSTWVNFSKVKRDSVGKTGFP